ncbi:2Fe-2S iron-sulfur cluster-binding protein [Peredibacter starrii]|uniref:2Fe-2S iron-sulfur cluster-binding protein n=1 Tax=Peredibacter starrii TaxID=28202 RepID=A0AAX4HST6_9BACT|nr:2Fe-2S iron-sulfur cluster-binding protein [Peredibacter starrii]WPU66168.1 2Fe-2S iron-sulfur cluster-binding protein [Peredibacter starrii]
MSNTTEIEIKKQKMDLNYASDKKPVHSDPSPDAKPLPKVTIDGKQYEFKPGDTIMEVTERYKINEDIPRYCYHPGMPVAGTCRMCTVEVEKAPKLMTSCSTPAADGMVVHTRSEKVMKSRTGVMDMLLTNHPLDCPVCDKAGECSLQDYNFEYGPSKSNFKEEKRVYDNATTKKLSDKITLNMNRCVHCERCVRFTDDVTKTNDLVMVNRGWHKELEATDPEKGLTNDYQGCLTDFCPVGALTMNDFRFQKRAWFLDKKASICDRCSKGCNIEVHSDKDIVYRYVPIHNEMVNGHWMCDEGRVSYNDLMNPMRVISPLLNHNNSLTSTSLETLLGEVKKAVAAAGSVQVVVGTDATREEAALLKEKMPVVFNKSVAVAYHSGFVTTSSEDKKIDNLLRMADKTPNTKGVEEQGLAPLVGGEANADLVILFRNGRAGVPKMKADQKLVLWGVWSFEDIKALPSKNIVGVIPGLATIEKSGSFKNADGIVQKFHPAITHRGGAVSAHQVVGALKSN